MLFRPPFQLPSPPASHTVSRLLPPLLLSPPPFVYCHAPVAPALFVEWVGRAFDENEVKWLRLNALELPSEAALFNALASFLSPSASSHASSSKPGSQLALSHAFESLSSSSYGTTPIVLIERAERLPAASILALSRFLDPRLSVFLLSEAPWALVRPAQAVEPYNLFFAPLTKDECEALMIGVFPSSAQASSSQSPSVSGNQHYPNRKDPHAYHPALVPIFTTYTNVLISLLTPSLMSSPLSLARIAFARWPHFVAPVLKQWRLDLARTPNARPPVLNSNEQTQLIRRSLNRDWQISLSTLPPPAPDQSTFVPALRAPAEWLSQAAAAAAAPAPPPQSQPELGEMAKWILVAAWLASANPARTDIRMFARVAEGRKRRRGGGPRAVTKTKKGITGEAKEKLPQRLLGPSPFPLVRLLAILGSLLASHFPTLERPRAPSPNSVLVYSTISELVERRLLHRVNADGTSMRCGAKWERVVIWGRELGLKVEEMVWDRNL